MRMRIGAGVLVAAGLIIAAVFVGSLSRVDMAAQADRVGPAAMGTHPLTCSMSGYHATAGLTAAAEGGSALAVTWEGDKNEELRLRLAVDGGTPMIQDLSVRKKGGTWATVIANAKPTYKIVAGWRRLDQEAYPALKAALGEDGVSQAVLDHYKWGAFWDAPLRVPGDEVAHGNSTPPPNGIPGTNQPGLPRKAEEIRRATGRFDASGCEVKTNGGRIEVAFPDSVQMGIFSGGLQYTVYKGTNLIRQELIAKTDEQSVAYKYDAGLTGIAIQPTSKVVWRDTSNTWQSYGFEAAVNKAPAALQSANRLVAVETASGSIAAFPPPHNFFWTREISYNLGYSWYQKESATSYGFGIRQPESEEDPAYAGHGPEDRRQNFELYNARPGSWQHMPIFFLVDAGSAQDAVDAALTYTRNDHFKAQPGYLVMARHFHTSPVPRLLGHGGLDAVLPDFELARAAGVNVYEPVGGGGTTPSGSQLIGPRQNAPTAAGRGASRGGAAGVTGAAGGRGAGDLLGLDMYYEMARLQSHKDFIVLPDTENPPGINFGGHNDIMLSHPVYFVAQPGRTADQPLVTSDATHPKIYHIGGPADAIEMAHRENAIFWMPHPDTKGSAGYPAAFKDKAFFTDAAYRGIGWRWGMDLDRSEQRLSDFRVLPLLDQINNWIADLPVPPKYLTAITETYENMPGDDFYANSPVTYVKVASQPGPDNWAPIVDALKRGDAYVTSGEVLINNYAVQGTGAQRTISADVEWTFPLEFVEVVWGDGVKVDRKIVPATDLSPFGKNHFSIPFDATGKKWVRFAVWDTAGNGAAVQPVKLN
jgi:hypothetical protein